MKNILGYDQFVILIRKYGFKIVLKQNFKKKKKILCHSPKFHHKDICTIYTYLNFTLFIHVRVQIKP